MMAKAYNLFRLKETCTIFYLEIHSYSGKVLKGSHNTDKVAKGFNKARKRS